MQELHTFRLIERISTLLRAEQRKKYTALGLQPVHAQVVEFLAKCNRHSDTPAAVGEYLGLTKGTMSQTLQVLERKGYIAKNMDVTDGRIIHLSLTEAGVKLVDEFRPLDVFEQAESLVAKQNFSTLEQALQATLEALQTANQSKSFGLCRTCTHFSEVGHEEYHCQLTHLPLTPLDAEKICREHSPKKH
jgi:MarR family transcriptional regulator, negative regulator of the multidrug operon emrRAB